MTLVKILIDIRIMANKYLIQSNTAQHVHACAHRCVHIHTHTLTRTYTHNHTLTTFLMIYAYTHTHRHTHTHSASIIKQNEVSVHTSVELQTGDTTQSVSHHPAITVITLMAPIK